jgi:heat shock protein HslJ
MIRLGVLLTGVLCLGVVTGCGDDDDSAASTAQDTASSTPQDTAPMEVPVPATDAGSASSLDGRQFVVTGVVGHDLVDGSELRITFQDGSLSANAGCNTMNGGYSFDGSTMQLEMLATTEMACPDALMAQDDFLAELLTSGPTVELDDDVLTISSGEVTLTLLDREVAEPDVALEGVTWQLDSLVSDDAVSSVPAGVESTLVFGDDGTVGVDTGCNSGSGTVEVGDGTLTFGPLATTLRFCEGDAGDVEAVVTSTLQGEVDYAIDSDVLSIRAADGSGLDYRAAAE